MIRTLLAILGAPFVLGAAASLRAQEPGVDPALGPYLQNVYLHWRDAVVRKDLAKWQTMTARHRQVSIRNRIYSERRNVAEALFDLPAAPPDVTKLKRLDVKVKGATANVVYFGAVDFEVGVEPPDNILILSFVKEGPQWKYDTADFVNLAALPEIRTDLAAGKLDHLKQPEFQPGGAVPPPRVELRGPVKYIAKTYVFCPGREVKVQVNKISSHLYQNTKESEIVIGGARDGRNEVQYAIKTLPGGQGNEPMTVRVYLLSQVQGVNPIKIFEYQVAEGGKPEPFGTGHFTVGPEEVKRLMGK
jgi:hypothetical protein